MVGEAKLGEVSGRLCERDSFDGEKMCSDRSKMRKRWRWMSYEKVVWNDEVDEWCWGKGEDGKRGIPDDCARVPICCKRSNGRIRIESRCALSGNRNRRTTDPKPFHHSDLDIPDPVFEESSSLL